MRVFIVHAHAEPQSFNGALTGAARESLEAAGHDVEVSDLYAMRFDPVSDRRNFTTVKDAGYLKQQLEEMHATERGGFSPDIAAEMDKLFRCDALVLQFPLWWFGMPAIMKGWVDRVFAMGRVYGGGRWYTNGVFKGKRAICSVTIGGPESMYQPDGLNGDLRQILFPIHHGMLFFTGFTVLEPFLTHQPARISAEDRAARLEAWRNHVLALDRHEPIQYPPLDAYGPDFRLKRGD
ncbi:MAG: NAD(P)H-dependent oxidoreductase [Candidatus Sumerlaeia bacterium]|nr:NAD(P)H-dependent oxidoreductase [Candidatus Sumerlaeia bacterium]